MIIHVSTENNLAFFYIYYFVRVQKNVKICVCHNHLKEFSTRCNLPSFSKVILSLNNFNKPAVENQCYLKRHGKCNSLSCVRMDSYLGRNYIYIFFGNIHSSDIEETFYVPALFLALGMQFTVKMYYMPGSK